MTFVALSWLVLARPGGTTQLGLLGVCYTAPVLVGGLAVGPVLDRFDKRTVLMVDSGFRAAVVATIPLTVALGAMPTWLPFVVAGCYGLLKMVPLAGFPAAIPQLVADHDLDSVNALESLSFSVASVVGPAAAGVLISQIGAANVLIVDSVSFLLFALTARTVRRPLRPLRPLRPQRPLANADGLGGQVPAPPRSAALASLRGDRVIVATTLAFMAFNIAEGMLMVAAPWLAKNHLPGGAGVLGALLSATAAGEMVGAALAGHRQPRRRLPAIGLLQILAGTAFLALLVTSQHLVVIAGFFAVGMLSAPMTVWAQSLRMRRIAPALHGRAFAALRTLMQSTPPIGTALVTPLLVHSQLAIAAVVMAAVAGLPGLYLLFAVSEESPTRAVATAT